MRKVSICEETGLKRGTWTPEEDKLLSSYIKRYGHWNWCELPKYAGLSRSGKSCRLRWMNYLRPNIKRGNYTKEEEDLIISLHEKLGNKWSAIAARLPGRTDNEVKNHWHTHLKKHNNGKLTLEDTAKRKPVERETPRERELLSTSLLHRAPVILESSAIIPIVPRKSCENSSVTVHSEVESMVTDESALSLQKSCEFSSPFVYSEVKIHKGPMILHQFL